MYECGFVVMEPGDIGGCGGGVSERGEKGDDGLGRWWRVRGGRSWGSLGRGFGREVDKYFEGNECNLIDYRDKNERVEGERVKTDNSYETIRKYIVLLSSKKNKKQYNKKTTRKTFPPHDTGYW